MMDPAKSSSTLSEQIVYSGTDGIISVTCLIAGLVGAGTPAPVVALAASIAAFADAISMGVSEFNARGSVRLAAATVLAFYLFAAGVAVVASRTRSVAGVFAWSAVCMTALAALKHRGLGSPRKVAGTVGVGVAGAAIAYAIGSLHAPSIG